MQNLNRGRLTTFEVETISLVSHLCISYLKVPFYNLSKQFQSKTTIQSSPLYKNDIDSSTFPESSDIKTTYNHVKYNISKYGIKYLFRGSKYSTMQIIWKQFIQFMFPKFAWRRLPSKYFYILWYLCDYVVTLPLAGQRRFCAVGLPKEVIKNLGFTLS